MSASASTYPAQVLVVDDDSFSRKVVAGRFQRLNAQVSEAADGAKALETLLAGSFDLVVLDLDMPGVDGLSLLGCIRVHPDLVHLPVVVLTGKEDRASLEAALSAGATSYLLKPLNWLAFNAHLGHLIDLVQRSRSANPSCASAAHVA